MDTKPLMIVGFMLILLFGVIALPQAMDRRDATNTETERIELGDTAFYNHQITIGVIDTGNQEATVQVIDSETGETVRATIPQNETETLQFNPGDLNVTNDLSNNQAATITLRYPANYGFSPGVNRVADYLPLILVATFFVTLMSFIAVKA